MHTQKMVRVGIDESLAQELLADFPPQVEIVRIPRHPVQTYDVDFWILPFARSDAREVFSHLRGVKAVQSMMAGVDWITSWLPKDVILCDGRGIHDISTSEWIVTAILSAMKRFSLYRDLQLEQQWEGQAAERNGFINETGPQKGLYRILGEDLAGKTVLLIVYGSICMAVEARLTPFDVKVVRMARTPKQTPEVQAIG